MATAANHGNLQCCFQNWIAQQHKDLEELVTALSANSDATNEEHFKLLCEKSIKHFEDYCESRAQMAEHHAPSLMSPTWCTPFENAFLWIGGCRPSLSIRLVYSVCGSELDAQLSEFLAGSDDRKGNLGEMSGKQLHLINSLHDKIVKEEDKMSTRMATIQEEMADEPLAKLAKRAGCVGEWSQELDNTMDAHSLSLGRILADADKLRLATFKDLMSILTPLQAVDLLVVTKKLHLSIHEWCKRRAGADRH